MISITWARFALAAIGLVVWAYGYRVDDSTMRWVGIAFLAVAVLLRFLPRRRPPAG
jgi:hypothetical protein